MNFDTFRKKRFPHMKDHGPLYEVARICYEVREHDPSWIPTKHSLPEIDEDVIFLTEHDQILVGSLGIDGDWQKYDSIDVPGTVVTHWMPLPPLPK